MEFGNARKPASGDAQPEAPQPQQHVFGDVDVQKLILEAGRHWNVVSRKSSSEPKD